MSRRNSIENVDKWLDNFSDDEPDSVIYDTDYLNDLAVDLHKQTEIPGREYYKKIVDYYAKFGLPPDAIRERISDYNDYLMGSYYFMDKNAQEEMDKCYQYKQDLLNKVQKMTSDLHLPPYVPDDNITPLQNSIRLKTEFNKLNIVREKRMSRWKELRDKQTQLCTVLGIKSPDQVKMQTDIPTDDELAKFANVILDLEKEERRRKEKYKVLKDMIIKCMDLLECRDQLVLDQLEEPDYSESNLKRMTEMHSKLEANYAANQQKYEKLKERLMSLYDRLDITGPERDQFLEAHTTCKPSSIVEMEVKISEYEELKKQNIGKFIEKIRHELVIEYDRCYINQDQQSAFFSLASEPCEELLELYEKELERLKRYYEDNRDILSSFEKWRLMWKELIDLEIKANDPNRFNNRGGQLLAEERKRKALQKNLPKVEKNLIELTARYLASNGEKFKVFGTNLDEFITGCWDELNHAKEVEKRERQRAKMTPSKGPAGRTGLGVARGTPIKRAVAGGSRLLGALSLSEQEFEAMAVARPTSAKRLATRQHGK